MALPIESDAERFERVSTIFDAAGFLHSLGIRLEKVGPDWCETSLDITDARAVQRTVAQIQPDVIINCAAFNDVDGAQDRVVEALEVNAFAVLALGRADEARPYFAQAYALLSQDEWLMDNEAARVARLKELGAA